jgi:hypothetical protein
MLIHFFADKVKAAEKFFQNVYHSASGLIKVLIISRFNSPLPFAKHEECIILGNGPSLKQSFEKHAKDFTKVPLICVNHFAISDEFYQYKPAYYVMLDPVFFTQEDRPDVAATINALKSKKVDWEVNVFIPYFFKDKTSVKLLREGNPFLKIHFFNYTIVKGFNSFAFGMFKKNLAMPQFYNVLGASMFLAVNMGYKKIWVVGADHSWFKEMEIDEDNILHMNVRHFYNKEKKAAGALTTTPPKVGDFFMALHRAFNSYYILLEYTKYMNCKIYNASEHSYIDAFERKKIGM